MRAGPLSALSPAEQPFLGLPGPALQGLLLLVAAVAFGWIVFRRLALLRVAAPDPRPDRVGSAPPPPAPGRLRPVAPAALPGRRHPPHPDLRRLPGPLPPFAHAARRGLRRGLRAAGARRPGGRRLRLRQGLDGPRRARLLHRGRLWRAVVEAGALPRPARHGRPRRRGLRHPRPDLAADDRRRLLRGQRSRRARGATAALPLASIASRLLGGSVGARAGRRAPLGLLDPQRRPALLPLLPAASRSTSTSSRPCRTSSSRSSSPPGADQAAALRRGRTRTSSSASASRGSRTSPGSTSSTSTAAPTAAAAPTTAPRTRRARRSRRA